MMDKLLDPESLKLLVPVAVGFIAACIGFFSACSVSIIGHFLNKRAEVNKIKIAKAYELTERIAQSMQRIENGYCRFANVWHANYADHIGFKEAIANFQTHQSLFQAEYELINQQLTERSTLGSLLDGAWVYLPPSLLITVANYLEVGNFSRQHDATGLYDNLVECFFDNLLDMARIKNRKKLYKKAATRIRRLKL
jgi:hypothetical protein